MKKVLGIVSCNYTSDAFGDLTDSRSIASLPFGGRYRMMDFALTNMVNAEISTIGIITPFFYRSISDHVGDGEPWGLARKRGGMFIMPGTVYAARENDKRFVLKDLIRNRRIMDISHARYVLLCDASKIMNIDFDGFLSHHAESGYKASYLYSKDGHVFLDCIVINIDYILEIMSSYKNSDDMDLTEVLELEKANNPVGEYVFDGYVGIINTISDYVRVNMDLLKPEVKKELERTEILTKIHDAPPTLYKEGSDVKNCVVSSGCIIKGSVENSIIARSVRIDEGARLKNCIVMQKVRIKKGAILENVILDKYTVIGENVVLKGSPETPIVIAKNTIM